MEGGRVSHSWCMCVVVMAMVGWMRAGVELVLGKHAGQSQVVGRMSGDAGAFPECVGNTLITPFAPPSSVDRDRRSFLSDRSLSKHSSELFSLIYL